MTKIINDNIIELNVIETGDINNRWNPSSSCDTCSKNFERGDKRAEWRLKIPGKSKYHNGSFWTVQCIDCAHSTCDVWGGSLHGMQEQLNTFLLTPVV